MIRGRISISLINPLRQLNFHTLKKRLPTRSYVGKIKKNLQLSIYLPSKGNRMLFTLIACTKPASQRCSFN